MKKLTVRDIEVSGKKVLVRADFNVPMNEPNGTIADDSRIRATLPTIKYLIDRGARIILCSHLGRPDGRVVENLRLTIIAQRLSEILGKPVGTTRDCIGPETEKAAAGLKKGEVLLLENLRFHAAEEKNDPVFAQSLARLAELYVNDAFGASHRSHASITGIAEYLPAVAGLLLDKELETLGGLLGEPYHPFGGLFGGAKVSDKVGTLENIMTKVDFLLIGGGMAATFLKAKSYGVGLSLVETDRLGTATELMKKATGNGVHLLLPVDVIVAEEISPTAKGKLVNIDNIKANQRIVDIGPRTIKNFSEKLSMCKTVFWNGPMGIYEIDQFAEGTKAMSRLLANLGTTTIIGGGSTAEVVTNMGLAGKMSFVSTGGGASLTFLGGQPLPGVEALLDKDSVAGGKLSKPAPAK